jgi:hypothetical protein
MAAAQPASHVAIAAGPSPATASAASAIASSVLLRLHHPQLRHPQRLRRDAGIRQEQSVRRKEVRAKANRSKVNQDPTKARRRGTCRFECCPRQDSQSRPRGFSTTPDAGAVLNCFGKVMDGLASTRMVLSRVRFQPCRYRANKNSALAPGGRILFLPSGRSRIAPAVGRGFGT